MKSKSITILTVLATLSFLFISLSAAPQKKNNKALQ
jgi:hypothetical protein